ncbi:MULTISPECIES: type I pantothenate kinase [unclassified Granulicatella]|uniref:type I pantothenate kinase n=1 Tax=unclassified Granulicatella TaxID=2630493 RepID=UPI0010732E0F|nr:MULTISPECIES: type I pantothenate kinase [unclassified Granulicatella]MBF0780811.1 type I pantothenate kinase [Granulicatella sp. 19428wC4_WM01]TFU93797.1 type I pantothenate kinase [Granulicatella sp. WM01]
MIENYDKIDRQEWKALHLDYDINLDSHVLEKLTSLNDRISMQDVKEIYAPMISLFDFYWKHHRIRHKKQQLFLHQEMRTVPFIIGISGSVSVGKSTTARLLQTILQQVYPDKHIVLMTTDGFLFPNQILSERGLLDRKGFPESYDMERLVNFLWAVKTRQDTVDIPVYSHDIYDIVPDTYQTINQPDILIVEGINVLQLPPNREIYVSDFFDWSIYVDADPLDIEQWFLERFNLLMDLAKNDPKNFYYTFAIGDRAEAIAMAKQVWKDTNLKNLEEYILPTKYRADFILHKTKNHIIDYVLLKKF